MTALRILVVDDEPLARSRLRALLADCGAPTLEVVGEAGTAAEALHELAQEPVDLVLMDVHMPGMDGVALARVLHAQPDAPVLVFVTADAGHALAAFELDAVDYLTKPVRAERLQQALRKAERERAQRRAARAEVAQETLLIQERGRAERVPLAEVLYLKSELKYLTVRTAARSYIMDGALADFEERHPERFLRVHRNALVARTAIRALVRHDEGQEVEGWALQVRGVDELLLVSRRQLAAVREALKEPR